LYDSPSGLPVEVSDSHVIMFIRPQECDKIVPLVLTLAEENGFNPQSDQVYLPLLLAAKQGGDTP
jgi:hypothetical protein